MKKLPLKTRILQYAIEKKQPFKIPELVEVMSKEYTGERFCNAKHIEKLILSFCGVSVMRPCKYTYDENGRLDVSYELTEFGKDKAKYIPGSEEHERAKVFQF
ncbi:MAG: hypothetical protein ACOX4R_07950 [Lentihominibacter sp.]|jgi:hypothetical protein